MRHRTIMSFCALALQQWAMLRPIATFESNKMGVKSKGHKKFQPYYRLIISNQVGKSKSVPLCHYTCNFIAFTCHYLFIHLLGLFTSITTKILPVILYWELSEQGSRNPVAPSAGKKQSNQQPAASCRIKEVQTVLLGKSLFLLLYISISIII